MNIRQFKETDRDFVTKSLLMSFMNGSKEVQKINRDSYMNAHNSTINKLLDRCECLLACDDQDDDLIYGFVIFEGLSKVDVLHYLYVRKAFRKKGIARDLLTKTRKKHFVVISHLTDEFKVARLKGYWEKAIYDPYTRISK